MRSPEIILGRRLFDGFDFDFGIGKFVAVILDEVFEFYAGKADEWFAGGEGGAESEFFVAVKDVCAELIHFGVFGAVIGDDTIKDDDAGGEFGAFGLGGGTGGGGFGVGGLPFFEGFAEGDDFLVALLGLGVEVGDEGVVGFLVGDGLFGESGDAAFEVGFFGCERGFFGQ